MHSPKSYPISQWYYIPEDLNCSYGLEYSKLVYQDNVFLIQFHFQQTSYKLIPFCDHNFLKFYSGHQTYPLYSSIGAAFFGLALKKCCCFSIAKLRYPNTFLSIAYIPLCVHHSTDNYNQNIAFSPLYPVYNHTHKAQ